MTWGIKVKQYIFSVWLSSTGDHDSNFFVGSVWSYELNWLNVECIPSIQQFNLHTSMALHVGSFKEPVQWRHDFPL